MLLLNNDDVTALLNVQDCIGAIEAAYRQLDAGEAAHRPRANFQVAQGDGQRYSLATMEGVSRADGYAAIRIRSDFVTLDPERGTETKYASAPGNYCGLVLLFDVANAAPVAILNDGLLQQLRVGATAAIAAARMARPSARVLGIIGAGNQARSHTRALAAIRPVERIRVYSPSRDRRRAFAAEMSVELGIGVEEVESARDAVVGSDLVAACTNATAPVLSADWLSPGTHLSTVRHRHEVGSDVLERADHVVIHVAPDATTYHIGGGGGTARQQGTSTPVPPNAPTLVDLLAGRAPGRGSDDEVTYFLNNVGTGLQFVACAALVHRRALEAGRGRQIPADWFLQQVSD